MAGQKFGTTRCPSRTWTKNVVVPAFCAERYAGARIVAFSTGNVYPLTAPSGGGSRETDAPGPVGEYAASCLGRERVFEHYSSAAGTKVLMIRLNYAIDLRYGVLVDIATRILAKRPVPLAMGYVNVIWQGDANRAALELLPHASSPAARRQRDRAETIAVRAAARELAARMKREVAFTGDGGADALLSDASRMRVADRPAGDAVSHPARLGGGVGERGTPAARQADGVREAGWVASDARRARQPAGRGRRSRRIRSPSPPSGSSTSGASAR